MKKLAVLTFALLVTSAAFAQDKKPSADNATFAAAMKKGGYHLRLFAEGGTGFGKRSSTQFFGVGGGVGWVLTGQHGSGWLKGNFEYAMELLPFHGIFQPPQNAYGVEIRPILMKWNFTSGKKIVPYAEVGGGMLITHHDVPFNTNNFNFTPQGGLGLHFFRDERHAITFEAKYLHVSNAGLANNNSGINASIQFSLGYTWFK